MFGLGLSARERALRDGLAVAIQAMGVAPAQAVQMADECVRGAIAKCKKNGSYAAGPMGERVLAAERATDIAPNSQALFALLRAQGVTDEDVRRWWDRSTVERMAEMLMHNALRMTTALSFVEQDPVRNDGLDEAFGRASVRLRKTMVLFGEPSEPADMAPCDRNLPWELRDRVMAWVLRAHATGNVVERASVFSSFNAFVRERIQAGSI